MLSGETPIALDWSYNVPGLAAELEEAGLTVETNFPTDGVYGGFYGQGVVEGLAAPGLREAVARAHPLATRARSATSRAARCRPAIEALAEAGLVDEAAKVNLPPDELIAQVEFLTPGPDRGRRPRCSARTGARWSPTPERRP